MSAAKTSSADPPLTAAEANILFSDLASAPAIVLAVSGGPDSTALLLLAAQWRARRKQGPKLLAVTVDHGLRKEAAAEARQVGALAKQLHVPHRTLRWTGKKPTSGLQQKARAMRYRLLADAAAKAGASHILTAHTLDDQAETVLMRLIRGSGPAGLAAMARETPLRFLSSPSPLAGEGWGGGYAKNSALENLPPSRRARSQVYAGCVNLPAMRVDLPRKGGGKEKRSGAISIMLTRPFLEIPKARLIATLEKAKIDFVRDPSNSDSTFTRVRMRGLLPALAEEGLGAPRLALLARRLRRAETALDDAVDRAAELAQGIWQPGGTIRIETRHFTALPSEVALRLLGRAVTIAGNEGPVELAKLEALQAAMTTKKPGEAGFRRTLAGAMVTLTADALTVERAPARRTALTTPRVAANKRPQRR